MNKVVMIIISVVVLLGVGLLVYKLVSKDKPEDPKQKNPKELEIMKDISAGIPYKWEVEIEDESIVEFVKSYVVQDDNTDGKVGAKIYTNYVFKGLKEGSTNIVFKFVNFTNNIVDSEDKYPVHVDKDLNISLIVE
jgi:hypothetical protein